MEMFPIGKLLSEHNDQTVIYNRGIGGFVSRELLDAMDVCILCICGGDLFIVSNLQAFLQALYGRLVIHAAFIRQPVSFTRSFSLRQVSRVTCLHLAAVA